ncbi:MAG: DNA-protecting protein DprA, partial [Candidatus Riflebacteria bacterium]|nr:DNA-protecting protein DprA [Candidatus Riflebacteria bacterium]
PARSGPGSADPRLPWLRLANLGWLGDTIKAGLVKEFGTAARALAARREELSRVKGWTAARLDRFLAQAPHATPLCPPELLDAKGVRLVTFQDPDYPPLLRQIPDSPVVLFALGTLPPPDRPAIAIVGSRQGTQLGFDIARDFARELAAAGFVIVSGLALGIDTFAHLGALDADGLTVGVLGNGPDVVYPAGNRRIRERLLVRGCVLSEYPPGTIARPWHFPVRNRVIAGLCHGTLVVEASARSGSLITARLAADQNREVFAIPGSIRSRAAEGTIALLQEGAQVVARPQDLIDYYAHLLPPPAAAAHAPDDPADDDGFDAEETALLDAMADDPVPLDRLLVDGRWSRDRLFSLLLSLEMRDALVKLPGNHFQSKLKTPPGRLRP